MTTPTEIADEVIDTLDFLEWCRVHASVTDAGLRLVGREPIDPDDSMLDLVRRLAAPVAAVLVAEPVRRGRCLGDHVVTRVSPGPGNVCFFQWHRRGYGPRMTLAISGLPGFTKGD